METRIAVIGIVVEEEAAVEPLNEILHQYREYIIGRMGIPYRQKNLNIISIAVDAPQDAISALSGKVHTVYTGCCLRMAEGSESFLSAAEVEFYPLSPEEIQAYIETGEPMDKAGAYGIQGRFAAYIDGIEGDYYNVVGLPVSYIYQELKKFGFIEENSCQ